MKKLLLIPLVLILISGLIFSGCPTPPETTTPPPKTLKIGLLTSATGEMAPAFKPMYDAVKPTEDLINQMGGVTVNGQKYNIEIIAEDDQSTPQAAVAAANKLIGEGVKFMIPPMAMFTNIAIAPVCEEAKILRLKAFGMGPEEVNPEKRYSFYSCSSLHWLETSFDYLAEAYPQAKRIAIVMPDDPGAKTAKDMAEAEIQERGLELVFSEAFPIGTSDYYPILTKALAQEPDAINMVVGIVPWAAGVINQSRELGFTGPIFCSCCFGDINLVNDMLNPEYAYDIFHTCPDVLSDKMPPIVQDLRKLVEQADQPFIMDSMLNLDALYPLLQCIKEAQSLDTDEVVDTIENIESIDTIWGEGRWGGQEIFGINHVIVRANMISAIINGNVEFWFTE